MNHPLLQIENLSVAFRTESGPVQALRNISFSVNRGEVVALVGESGSGKSVTSLSVLQLLPAPPAQQTTGRILFSRDGREQRDLISQPVSGLQHIRGNRIAMIFQEPMTSLNPVMTCGQQVLEALQQHKSLDAETGKEKVTGWFRRVNLPDPETVFTKYPHQLSGGQKQRVMIAMAMCCEPDLLICDEPTTALDVTVQKTILELIRELQKETGMGVIFITHDLGVVAQIANRAIVMYRGDIVEANTVRELFRNPQHPYTRALLACRPVNHTRGQRLPVVSDFMGEQIARQSAEVKPVVPSSSSSAEKLIEVKNLTVEFPVRRNWLGKTTRSFRAVDEISFDVFKNETLGLVGESGCGKTTLGRALLKLNEPSAGEIIFRGKSLATQQGETLRKLRRDIQIIFQDPYSSLNPRITIGSAIAEPLQVHGLISSSAARKDRVVELLEKVSLKAEHFSRYPHEFSGGQRQRIVIARALALEPDFIVCDESVSALDVSVQAQVLNLLNDLKRELGFTVVFISHDLSVVRYISDRILVMQSGKLVECGPADEIYLRPQAAYTRSLVDAIPQIPAGISQ